MLCRYRIIKVLKVFPRLQEMFPYYWCFCDIWWKPKKLTFVIFEVVAYLPLVRKPMTFLECLLFLILFWWTVGVQRRFSRVRILAQRKSHIIGIVDDPVDGVFGCVLFFRGLVSYCDRFSKTILYALPNLQVITRRWLRKQRFPIPILVASLLN